MSGSRDFQQKRNTKEQKADGRVDPHATGYPWSDGLQRVVEQPLIDSQFPSQQVFERGNQTDDRGDGGGPEGDQPGKRFLGSDRSIQQGDTQDRKSVV